MKWSDVDEPVSWNEAWEIARPWVKDPQVHQPPTPLPPRLGCWGTGLSTSMGWTRPFGRYQIRDQVPSLQIHFNINFVSTLGFGMKLTAIKESMV